jgi:hypothetical protein
MMMLLSSDVFLVSPVVTASSASLSRPRPLSAHDLETAFRPVHEAFVVDLWLRRVAIEGLLQGQSILACQCIRLLALVLAAYYFLLV